MSRNLHWTPISKTEDWRKYLSGVRVSQEGDGCLSKKGTNLFHPLSFKKQKLKLLRGNTNTVTPRTQVKNSRLVSKKAKTKPKKTLYFRGRSRKPSWAQMLQGLQLRTDRISDNASHPRTNQWIVQLKWVSYIVYKLFQLVIKNTIENPQIDSHIKFNRL